MTAPVIWPAKNPTHRPVGWCTRCDSPILRAWFWGEPTCRCGVRKPQQRKLEVRK